MGRTLVAGGTGSLGTALVSRLVEAGADVVVMAEPRCRVNATLAALDVEFRFADIRDRDAVMRALRGVDRAYNLAGIAVPLDRLHNRMVAVNVQGARIFAECCAHAGVSRVVHVSSISAIGYPPRGEVADETFDFGRSVCMNSYALTKRGGEDAVREVVRRTGLELTILVPAAVVAPWSDLGTGWAALVRLAQRGRLVAYPPGGLSLCSLEAFLSGAEAAAEKGGRGERYIVTTTNTSYAEFFALVCRTVGRPAPQRKLPERALRGAAAAGRAVTFGTARSPLCAKENVDLMTNHLQYDNRKARAELGFVPGDVGDSLRAVRAWLEDGAR